MPLTSTFSTISAGQTDPNSPLDTILLDAIRQNLDVMYEWMGGPTYTPSTSHNHNGTNSAPVTLAIQRDFTTSVSENFTLVAGASYRLFASVTQNSSAGSPLLRFSSDSSAVYSRGATRIRDGVSNLENSSAANSIPAVPGVTSNPTDKISLWANITPAQGNNNDVHVSYSSVRHAADSQANVDHVFGTAYYNGSADVTSLQFLTDNGSMTGYLALERIYVST